MKKNLKKYILNHIRKLGIKEKDKLLVYSDLSKFGINKYAPKDTKIRVIKSTSCLLIFIAKSQS